MTSMNLTIYIDKKLLEPNPSTGLPNIGNLAFARKVGGVANVIFQSKTTAYFSEGNQFQWQQSYQIGANLTPPQPSTFVSIPYLILVTPEHDRKTNSHARR